MPYCTPPIVNSWSKKGELPNSSPERGVPPTFEIESLEVPRPAERAARLRDSDRVHRARGGKRQVDACVAQQGHAERRADAVVAAQRREAGVGAGERLVVDAVRDEQPGIAIAEDGEPELETRAPTAQRPEVRDGVPQPRIVDVERAREAGLANRGVCVRDGEVADVLAELPLEVAFLALTEQVRIVE